MANLDVEIHVGWSSLPRHGAGAVLEERPYRWSQRWSDDPPPGTTVNLGGGLVEVHVGRGIWQTVAGPV